MFSARADSTAAPNAIQVERALLDHLLLKHTRASGADVREGWTVSRFDPHADGVSVEARDPAGKLISFARSYLIDATGRGNLTGNQENLREDASQMEEARRFRPF